MPVLILLGFFGVWGAVDLHDTCSKKGRVCTDTEMENMLKQMVGKSKKEARKIVRMYMKR